MMFALLVVGASALDAPMRRAVGFSAQRATHARRRSLLGGALASLVIAPGAGVAAVLSAPVCANGVGEGCAELAGDSPLLQDMQRRSAEQRERRAREALDRYSVNNFSDYFAVENKALVRHRDGTYEAVTKDKIAAGLKSGGIVYGGSSGGVADFATNRAPFAFSDADTNADARAAAPPGGGAEMDPSPAPRPGGGA